MNVARALLIGLAAVVRSASVIVTVGGTVSTVKDRDTTSLLVSGGVDRPDEEACGGRQRGRDAAVSELAPEQAEKPSPS